MSPACYLSLSSFQGGPASTVERFLALEKKGHTGVVHPGEAPTAGSHLHHRAVKTRTFRSTEEDSNPLSPAIHPFSFGLRSSITGWLQSCSDAALG